MELVTVALPFLILAAMVALIAGPIVRRRAQRARPVRPVRPPRPRRTNLTLHVTRDQMDDELNDLIRRS